MEDVSDTEPPPPGLLPRGKGEALHGGIYVRLTFLLLCRSHKFLPPSPARHWAPTVSLIDKTLFDTHVALGVVVRNGLSIVRS